MKEIVNVQPDFPFAFCQRCEKLDPVTVDHRLYGFDRIEQREIAIGCQNREICEYVASHILMPDPQEEGEA